MLNKLPDSIVHHILFFLPIKDLSRLSCVSRRCRDLCISTPYVALSNMNYTITEITRRFRFNNFRFNNFVDRFMSRRNWHGTKLHTFILHWCFEPPLTDEAYRVDTWLSHAVNSGVQRIQLELSGTERFPLPRFILSCKSMSFLSVKTNDSILKLPSTSSAGRGINTTLQILVLEYLRIEDDFFGEWLSQFKSLKRLNLTRISRIKRISFVGCGIDTSLQTLVLDSVQIEEDDYFGEWLSHFKTLKVLNLTRIRGVKSMSIHNSSIDVLTIKDCDDLVDISIFAEKLRKLHIHWHPHNKSSSVGSLKILAPNLEDFRWGGHVVDYYCIEDFSSKLNLIIALRLSDQLYESSTKYYLHKILCSMQRAKVLSLRDEFVEVLFKYGCLPCSFDNLEHLTIVRMSSFGDKIPAVSSLLRETRSLKWLFLLNDTKVPSNNDSASVQWPIATGHVGYVTHVQDWPRVAYPIQKADPSNKLSFKLEYWESQNLMFINQLKGIFMELSNRGSDVELMKYLLKNTKELAGAVIIYSQTVPTNLIIELRKYKTPPTELVCYHKSSKFVRQIRNRNFDI